jgi:cellulose synthase/poly-beta-1,6-N-acetylglucosamine synthase-like glycosyltransferase
MMILLVLIIILLLSVTIIQLLISSAYWWQLLRPRQKHDSSKLPKAAVILSLRGSDPFVFRTLQALLKQNYPNYTIFLIIDHQDDPVWDQVNQVLEHTPKGKIITTILSNPKTTCGLKCSSLIQVIKDLDSSYRVVAFTDADVITHSTWLRDLVTPLSDPDVGVSTGNRWYIPNGSDWGSLFRYVWNIGSVTQVWLNNLVWGGSMAMRLDVIKRIRLLQAWEVSMGTDSAVASQIKKYGYRVAFANHVMMCNEEQTSFKNFFSWIQRQTFIGMSSRPLPILIPIHAFFLLAIQFLGAFAVWGSLNIQDQTLVYLSLLAWSFYWISSFIIIMLLENTIRGINQTNGGEIQWTNLQTYIKLIPTIISIHIIFPIALVIAMRRHEFEWRGIKYKLDGNGNFAMESYLPYHKLITKKTPISLI